ncbi:MAG: DUF1365 family protein, partial [Pseudomonadota bacterium]
MVVELIAKLIKCGEAASFSLWEKVGRKEIIAKINSLNFLQKPSPRPSPKGRGSFAITSINNNFLLIANVMHARMRPRKNSFVYKVYYLCFPLSHLSQINNPILSLNKFNIFSYFEKDHGARDGSSNEAWIRKILLDWNIPEADGEIIMLTMPRILGHVFNP